MADIELDIAPNEGTPIPDTGAGPDLSPAELRASGDGWRPLAEWEGDESDWVDAKTFNVKGELMARISQQGKKLAALENDNSNLNKLVKQHGEVTRQMTAKAYKQAQVELRNEKAAALRDGDVERVMEIDDAVDELKAAKAQHEATPVAAAPAAPARGNWTPQQNAWYDMVTTTPWMQDPTKNQVALKAADDMLNADPNMPVGDFIGKLNDLGRTLNTGSRTAPSGPDDGKGRAPRPTSKSGKFTGADLDSMETAIGKEFVADEVFASLDEYATVLGKGGNLQSQMR